MNIITQVILPLILAFIMFSMGLSLVIDDFKRVVKFPKAFMIGALLQILSLPILAFLITNAWVASGNVDPALAVGMIIIAACPGGVTSNIMTHLGGGDTALSISLTAIISIISVFTIPFIVNYGYFNYMDASQGSPLPIAKTIIGVFSVTTIPVMIGMLINHKSPTFAAKLEPLARKIATIFFVLIVLAAVGKEWKLALESLNTIGPVVLGLNLATMIVAILVSKITGLSHRQSVAITFECGLQNGTLAIMIAATFLKNEVMMLPGGIYSILMFITGCGYLFILNRKNKQIQNEAFAS